MGRKRVKLICVMLHVEQNISIRVNYFIVQDVASLTGRQLLDKNDHDMQLRCIVPKHESR